MFCNSCEERAQKGQTLGVSTVCVAGPVALQAPALKGINQCQGCRCAISRVGFAVLPRGRHPMTRKERILDRRGRRRPISF